MKTNKLRGHEFRYLVKEHVKNPMAYIYNFYEYETDIHYWLRDIHLLINTGVCPELNSPQINHSYGYTCKQLIEQVEAAYVIFRQQNLEKQDIYLDFFPTQEDYVRYSNNGACTVNGEINPLDTIAKFFSYQNLERWYDTLDELWMGLSCSKNEYNDRFGDKILIIRELFLRLAHAMYDLLKQPQRIAKDTSDNYETTIQVEETNQDIPTKNGDEESLSVVEDHPNKLKYLFEYNWLSDWQAFLKFWEKSIFSQHENWIDAFAEYKPVDQLAYINLIRNLFENLNRIASGLFHRGAEKDEAVSDISMVSTIFRHEKGICNLKALSLAEISNSDYHLPILFWEYSLDDWKLLIEDWADASFRKEPYLEMEDQSIFPKDFMKLRKIIELSFLIVYHDEIEFVHHDAPQESKNYSTTQ